NCYGAQICEAGLACASSSIASCPTGVSYCCAESGELGQPCNADSTCNAGLACIGGLCHATTGPCGPADYCATGTTCVGGYCIESGGADQPCNNSGDACDTSDLVCVGWPWTCPPGLGQCCTQAGGDGQPCLLGNTCNTDLACYQNAGCPASAQCCGPAGALNEPCNSDDTCDLPLELACVDNPAACPFGYPDCCLTGGGFAQPCLAGGVCNEGTCTSSPSCPIGLTSCCL
ncbi:MAG: hypothetical protein JXR83_20155, partial [Deltaproteobacteria bacterium]|nr:hypothetical protein [Deltaproteobacteria bacterium]